MLKDLLEQIDDRMFESLDKQDDYKLISGGLYPEDESFSMIHN